MKNKKLNNIEKAISYPARKAKDLPPKLKTILKFSKGGPVEDEDKPTNVIPLPIKPGTEQDWMKTASKDDYLELLNKVFDANAIKDLSEDELKELLEYTIATGGIG